MRLEDQIINGLLYDEEYSRQVIPFIKVPYFEDKYDKLLISEIIDFHTKYNKRITKDILEISVLNRTDLTGEDEKQLPIVIESINESVSNREWLINETEKFFQRRAVYLAILESIAIFDGHGSNDRREDSIPLLLQDALNVSFDTSVGHDYTDDAIERFEHYNQEENGIKFDLDIFNKITGGVGLRPKTLSCVAAPSGKGKSVFLCHVAASTLLQGKNVLYITMEMSEYKIAERIDANLFDVSIQNIKRLSKDDFQSKINIVKSKNIGKLKIKEYPTGSVHAGHFRALLEELKSKNNFVPDLICIDYLGICASQRIKNHAANSYTILKSVAEEFRTLAIEYNVPVLTAVQMNRAALESTDVEMGDISDSVGIIFTLDFYFAMMRTEELDEIGQVMIKQLKNRYGDLNYFKRFVVGLDPEKMRFYNLEQSAQSNICDSGSKVKQDEPVFLTEKRGKKFINGENFLYE